MFDTFEIVVPRLAKQDGPKQDGPKVLTTKDKLEPWTTQVFYDVVFTRENPCRHGIDKNYEDVKDNSLAKDVKDNSLAKDVKDNTSLSKVLSTQEFYSLYVERTLESCVLEAMAPQRSSLWHDARRYCITASNFGSVVGHNPYCSPEQAMIEKLWASFQGSESTAYGTFHEPDAAQSLIKALEKTSWLSDIYPGFTEYKFFETGLLKSSEQPWMAVSPDGFLAIDGPEGLVVILIEFKCPASQRDSELHPYRKSPKNVPVYYMDQIQGIMGLLNKYPKLIDMELERQNIYRPIKTFNEALFVVWQPMQMHVTRVPFDLKYYSGYLEPELKKWHDKFVVLATEKANGRLVKNTLEIIIHL